MRKNARYWIEKMELSKHPEGGCFAPAFRSTEPARKECLPRGFSGGRSAFSSIYYLLEKGDFSAFHRLNSVELWNYCAGSPLILYLLDEGGEFSTVRLGRDPEAGEVFQFAIQPGCWFAGEVSGPEDFSLVSCTVVPGFEWDDFELARREELAARYPQHRQIIEKLTRI